MTKNHSKIVPKFPEQTLKETLKSPEPDFSKIKKSNLKYFLKLFTESTLKLYLKEGRSEICKSRGKIKFYSSNNRYGYA